MPSKKFSDANNPLSGGGDTPPKMSVFEADREIYGGDVVGIPRSGIIKAPPMALTEIRTDMKQPRRIIPAVIRKGWTGDVTKIPSMIREWRMVAEKTLGEPIDMIKLLDKMSDGREADKDIPPIVDEYLALCALAASIKRDGLANPIQVTRANVIVTGERRYMAHWLLHTWLGGFDSIPAQVVGEADVWLQAAENGARKPLNAIGMARQLALLIMEMYVGDDGVKFDDITFFNHEREFYAQVSNGVSYPIKKGLGERVLQVTGLNSKAQVNQYRALLKVSNDLWDEADTNNYAEGRIREMVKPQDRSTIVDLSAQNGGQAQAEFYRMLGSVLADIRNGKGETGLYLVLGGYHVFVWYHHAKRCYEMLRWSGEDVHVRDLVDAKAALGVMYDVSPTTGRWRVANKSEFDKATRPNYGAGWSGQMVAPSPTPAPSPQPPPNIQRVMHDIGIGEDDEYEDVRHPFGGGDDDPEYQLHLKEMAQIQADFADYVPSDAPIIAPKNMRYIPQDSLLHHFIAMVIGWGDRYNHRVPSELARLRDMMPSDIARMVAGGLAPDEIAQDLTEMGNRVLEYLAEVLMQISETQKSISSYVQSDFDQDKCLNYLSALVIKQKLSEAEQAIFNDEGGEE